MSEFRETSVSRRVVMTIEHARHHKWNAAIVGEAGVGKTRALNEYAAGAPGVHMFTVTAVTGNALRELLRELSELIGIYGRGSIAQIQRQMFQYDLSDRVLIVDEAQNLKLQAFREILHLNDFTRLPVIFCGNGEVLKRVNVRTGAFAQISDRVAFRETVDCILDADADAIANTFGVEGADAYQMMRDIGAHFHARGIVRVLEVARELVGEGKIIKALQIRAAIDRLPQYRPALSRLGR